jgi:hypothetical protein
MSFVDEIIVGSICQISLIYIYEDSKTVIKLKYSRAKGILEKKASCITASFSIDYIH